MKTFCIKTNNTKIIDYLINELENLTIDNVYYCSKKFKIYKNLEEIKEAEKNYKSRSKQKSN